MCLGFGGPERDPRAQPLSPPGSKPEETDKKEGSMQDENLGDKTVVEKPSNNSQSSKY